MADQEWEKLELESAYVKKCQLKWAALIKVVYEVDPLKCPKYGGTMKIISYIEYDATIKKILQFQKVVSNFPKKFIVIVVSAPMQVLF